MLEGQGRCPDDGAGAVNGEVQWACATAIGLAHVQSSLAPTKGAEIWYGPAQVCQPQEAFYETCGLPGRHCCSNQ
ncbi:hypothetical protein GGQ68_001746 [Sagittula marina]|uniref:Uncharacterized protein n=1 Tax=Sagittula marina TaxID=943940 RepID=A0A7W6DMA1_9RHOB|nr:hypothetical protein [Sagittula marina]